MIQKGKGCDRKLILMKYASLTLDKPKASYSIASTFAYRQTYRPMNIHARTHSRTHARTHTRTHSLTHTHTHTNLSSKIHCFSVGLVQVLGGSLVLRLSFTEACSDSVDISVAFSRLTLQTVRLERERERENSFI